MPCASRSTVGRVGRQTPGMSVANQLAQLVAPLHGTFGVYARNLGTSEVADVNADSVLPTESAAKILILLHYSRLVGTGECDPLARVAVPDDFRFNGTGVLRYLASGVSL